MGELRVLKTPAAAITATGNGAGVETPQGNKVGVQIEVTAVGGSTPSVTFEVQWSNDGVNFCSADPADAFTAITANKNVAKAVDPKAPFCRLAWAVTGTTPTFTVDSCATGHGSC